LAVVSADARSTTFPKITARWVSSSGLTWCRLGRGEAVSGAEGSLS